MTSIGNDVRAVWNARSLVMVMVRREVAARHAGTAVGILWPYLQPLLTVAAYYLVFDIVFSMRLGEGASTHAVGTFLVVGALPWMAFCDAIGRGMGSLLEAGAMLQKNPLPPVLFPVRAVLASTAIFGPLMLLVALCYAPLHHFQSGLLALLPLMLLQLLMSLLLAYALAIFAAALRDTVQLVGFALSVGIYLTPILFPITMFPENWRWVLWLNPMASYVLGYQSVLLQGQWPTMAVWAVGLVWIGLLAGVLNILIRRSRDQLVDWL
ncbi:ABC transporter permease [Comamonas sp. JUb58]|uniref:ABC transporter permease n=1 Tax=Comamonas sp. JUb58 TaxID=2485114 RepID=UPI0010619968|nr:ABC transporter permease [Comamonas sp. JUb58]TDS83117.1 lipopolysaccharide transport system permease protein [Comamonas sp. JUb58]